MTTSEAQSLVILAEVATSLKQIESRLSASTREVLTEKEAANYLKVRPQTLALWRTQCRGPVYSRVEGAIRYRRQALDLYLESTEVPR